MYAHAMRSAVLLATIVAVVGLSGCAGDDTVRNSAEATIAMENCINLQVGELGDNEQTSVEKHAELVAQATGICEERIRDDERAFVEEFDGKANEPSVARGD